MLNKSLCLKCRLPNRVLFRDKSAIGKVSCAILFADGKSLCPIRMEPPDDCPYLLEQILTDAKNTEPEGEG